MSQVTVTDVQEVAMMDTDDIRKWISLHQKSLKDDEMADYHDTIRSDLEVLQAEYDLRNPLVIAIKDLTYFVKQLNETLKEKENGNTKD